MKEKKRQYRRIRLWGGIIGSAGLINSLRIIEAGVLVGIRAVEVGIRAEEGEMPAAQVPYEEKLQTTCHNSINAGT